MSSRDQHHRKKSEVLKTRSELLPEIPNFKEALIWIQGIFALLLKGIKEKFLSYGGIDHKLEFRHSIRHIFN